MTKTAKATHTPEPWTYKATAGNHDFAVYPEATGRDVALVRDFNEANARLIAESPAMLKALRLIVEQARLEAANPDGFDEPLYEYAIRIGFPAIAKAEGRTP